MVNTSDVKLPVLLIDLSSLYWQAFHATANELASVAKENTLNAVRRCMKDGDWLVAICCDVGRSFRKDLSPAYKAHREKAQEAAYAELDRTKERLKADGFLLWGAEGFEADDVIATACCRAIEAGHSVRVASADKDLAQLIRGDLVDQLKTHTWDVMTQMDLFTKYGVLPDQFGDFLALTGDKSDGIEGAPGIGPVRAKELLTTWGSWSLIKRKLEKGDLPGSTPAVFKSLSENIAKIDLAKQLVTLRTDAPINFDEIYAKRDMQPLTEVDLSDIDEPEDSISEGPKGEPAPSATGAEEATTAVETRIVSIAAGTAGDAAEQGKSLSPLSPTGHGQVEYTRALEPTSIGSVYKLAKGLWDSRLYQRFQNPEAIMAVIMRGREMGLGALTSLDAFHVIEGRPSPWAYLLIARAKADPDCEYLQCIETTAEGATWETKSRRNGRVITHSYTLAEAKASNLVKPGASGKPNQWMVRPRDMCRKTAGLQLARMEYPDSMLNMYAIEELES